MNKWQVNIKIWQVNIMIWQEDIKIWQVNIIIWQVMAEVCHHTYAIWEATSIWEALCFMVKLIDWLLLSIPFKYFLSNGRLVVRSYTLIHMFVHIEEKKRSYIIAFLEYTPSWGYKNLKHSWITTAVQKIKTRGPLVLSVTWVSDLELLH